MTGDPDPPRFAQLPLVHSTNNALSVNLAASKVGQLVWVLAYENILADFRQHQLSYKSADISTEQVLSFSGVYGPSENSTGRTLQQQVLQSGLQGAVVAWGSVEVKEANVPFDIALDPPCLEGTGMCSHQQDALSPSTAYKVCFLRTFLGHLMHKCFSARADKHLVLPDRRWMRVAKRGISAQ
jgi:hypothetical protein